MTARDRERAAAAPTPTGVPAPGPAPAVRPEAGPPAVPSDTGARGDGRAGQLVLVVVLARG